MYFWIFFILARAGNMKVNKSIVLFIAQKKAPQMRYSS
jgi:hypothetical protein